MAASNLASQQHRAGGADDDPVNPQQLVEDAMAGDRTALERLLLIEYAAVHRHIEWQLSAGLRDYVSVEDVLQESFSQAFRDLGQFSFQSQDSLRNWLFTIADHRIQDLGRRLRRKKHGGGLAKIQLKAGADRSSLMELTGLVTGREDSPSQAAARGEVVQAIHVGLATLPDDQREAVRRCYVEHQDYGAAAKAMGRSPQAVRSLVYRAQHSLRGFMGRTSRWFSKR